MFELFRRTLIIVEEQIVFAVGYGDNIKWFEMPLKENTKLIPIDGEHRKSIFAEYADGTRKLNKSNDSRAIKL